MKFIKKMLYDTNAAPFIDKNSALAPLLTAVLAAGSGAAVALLTVFQGQAVVFGWSALGLLLTVFVWAAVQTVYCIRFPYNAVLDDEHLFIRNGNGYLKFHKFDFGTICYRDEDSECTVAGHGTENFLIGPARITFQNAIKPIRRRIKRGEKLGYMLMSAVQTPHSGVNWSLAYDSLPAVKRKPAAF